MELLAYGSSTVLLCVDGFGAQWVIGADGRWGRKVGGGATWILPGATARNAQRSTNRCATGLGLQMLLGSAVGGATKSIQ